ncbi:MAG: T9SS C-terminal target domain-containing protein [Raineya sp.]|nr:T9SS C-terminal target domain-containing protein [Raineya sp.]
MMKTLFYSLLAMAVLAFAACNKKKDETPTVQKTPDGKIIVQGEIKGEVTWKASEKYLLRGFVYVTEGSTLTIEPGTKIFGDKDSKGTLIVERGGKIFAEGTVDNPIVFTSNLPAGSRGYGDWGGVVIAGNAPTNQVGASMEGGIRGTFGGSDPNDNSGVLKYVRIEFAGIAFQPDKEINGLTLYGVGRGTKIEYIQVSYNGDDSFEWFGGNVDSKYLVAFRGWDDDFDTDWGFSGRIQFAFGLRDRNFADKSTSNAFESDNFDPGDSPTGPYTSPVFANVTCYVADEASQIPNPGLGSGSFGRGMHLRRNTRTSVFNSVFVGFPEGLRLDGASTWQNTQSNELQMRGVVVAGFSGTNYAVSANTGGTFTTANVQSWFDSNNTYTTTSTLQLGSIGSLNNPQRLPNPGSPLLSGAVWTGKAADAFFEKVNFRGAFGTTDWTQGWTNFNPQATNY